MTSDFDLIQKETGFAVGNLYLSQPLLNPIPFEKEEGTLYDKESKNFHLYPEDKGLRKELSEKVGELRKNIVEKLYEKYDKEIVVPNTQSEFKKLVELDENKDKIIIYKNNNGRVKNSENNALYKYIGACKNGILYELSFMRFYISSDRKINCILNCIQFDRAIGTEDITRRCVNKNNGICYPTAYTNHLIGTLQKKLEQNKEKSFFYNPPCDFEDAEAIAMLFVHFIHACDEYRS